MSAMQHGGDAVQDGEFDFIVVGGGSAGCVLAARLCESGRHSVLLLEAGGEDRSPWIHIPIGYAKLFGNPRYNWMYATTPEPALGGRVLDQPCGRVLGGTGAINGMLYVRGQPDDYESWRALGNEGWGWDDVLPWFRRSEHNTRGADALHGGDGPLWVSDTPQTDPLADAFINAAVEAGHPRNPDFNGAMQEGAGYYQFNTRNGRRASTAIAYLRPARRRANLAVFTDVLVSRVLIEQGKAVGVEYRRCGEQRGALRTVRARREVVVAAGTFNSPQILQLSGIGPAAQLRQLGLAVVCDRPGVGEGLHNHYRASIVQRCSQPLTYNDIMQSLTRRAWMGLQYALTRKGPMAAGTYAGGFFRSSAAVARPDMQVTFWNYSVQRRDAGGVVLHPFPGYTANAVLLRPQSRGWVRAVSADPAIAPQIRYNHLEAEYDRSTLLDGLRTLRDILRKPALAAYAAEEIAPGAACDSDEALLAYVMEKGHSVYHPVGTCRMGSDAMAVVDARLKVHGVDRLRVADASVMPGIVSGNTNAPTVMIAERCADWMLADG